MPAPEKPAAQPRPTALSMRELLASCEAATAVSTPPRKTEARETEDGSGQGVGRVRAVERNHMERATGRDAA